MTLPPAVQLSISKGASKFLKCLSAFATPGQNVARSGTLRKNNNVERLQAFGIGLAMRVFHPIAVVIISTGLLLFGGPSSAALLIEIDKSTQQMTVSQDGAQLFTWPVSTGTRAHDTPSGNFSPIWMKRYHFSREWDDAPMPHSIFFTKRGHAIHGTEHARNIGRPASHGCVRLAPENARALFDLVKREGMTNTRVELTGIIPSSPEVASRTGEAEVTGSIRPRRIRRYQSNYRLPYWGPSFGHSVYRRAPLPFYPGPRYGWY